MDGVLIGVAIFIAIIIIYLLTSAIRIIRPYERGIYIFLGRFRGVLNPGLNFVWPFSQVIRMDMRTQTWDVPKQEVITRDNSPTAVDAVIYIRVVDAKKAFFEVQDYKLATINLARTTLRSVIGNMNLDEILYNREHINTHLRDILDEATDKWGVKVEAVEIKEVDPAARVKQAMEAQTAAERERRAAILKADGIKRSQILEAEGKKRARILEAEGKRQAQILEAQGLRLATILQAQGEAQRYRIISLGSAALTSKALSVISLDTLTKVANGQATKIIFPFEISKLIESTAKYLAGEQKEEQISPLSYRDIERIVGNAKDILGPIPSYEEIASDLKKQKEKEEEEKKLDLSEDDEKRLFQQDEE
ncbi:membrane protease subunit, stomatin/prohibitin [Aciduliprofundum sp. MAR08-339]|uniref:SPFH domain-containing protein n=1 Tax=Aciduliprofundum sp. (strain MAR08-339) TaxID=673860 RepID=UPI0002A4BB31|nr:membrane protease subunit, stomatin/prohibitin [Aciduliprofundum sp. MAR08-339]